MIERKVDVYPVDTLAPGKADRFGQEPAAVPWPASSGTRPMKAISPSGVQAKIQFQQAGFGAISSTTAKNATLG